MLMSVLLGCASDCGDVLVTDPEHFEHEVCGSAEGAFVVEDEASIRLVIPLHPVIVGLADLHGLHMQVELGASPTSGTTSLVGGEAWAWLPDEDVLGRSRESALSLSSSSIDVLEVHEEEVRLRWDLRFDEPRQDTLRAFDSGDVRWDTGRVRSPARWTASGEDWVLVCDGG